MILVASTARAMEHGPTPDRPFFPRSRLSNSEIDNLSSSIVVYRRPVAVSDLGKRFPHAYARYRLQNIKVSGLILIPVPKPTDNISPTTLTLLSRNLHITYGFTSPHLTPSCTAKPRSYFHDRESWGWFHINCRHELTILSDSILNPLCVCTPPDGTDHCARQYTYAHWVSQYEWQFGSALRRL